MEYLGKYTAQNYNTNRTRVPKFIVIHTTEGTYPTDVEYLCGNNGVSAHIYISPDCLVYKLLPFVKIAYHCGIKPSHPEWRTNRPDLWALWGPIGEENEYAIGIEVSAPDNQPMSEAQFDTLVLVVKDLLATYPTIIPDRLHIVGHYELKTIKKDPPNFNWSKFMSQVTDTPTQIIYNGYTIKGGFYEFFTKNGGLEVFGYPLTNEEPLDNITVQYFEDSMLEYHPENPPGQMVVRGHIGKLYLQKVGRLT